MRFEIVKIEIVKHIFIMDSSLFDRVLRFVREQVDLEQPSFVTPLEHSDRLKLYGLYKQATFGKCTGPRPSFFDMHNKYKYDAWSELGEMSRNTAMCLYVETVIDYIMSLPRTFSDDELASMSEKDRWVFA